MPYDKMVYEKLLSIEMNNTRVKINKPVYLGLLSLNISKIAVYDYWYDCLKPNMEILLNHIT